MRQVISSPDRIEGVAVPPGDKSISHRALLLNSIAQGTAHVSNICVGDDRISIRAFGIDVTTELCRRLLEQDVPGLHFYSMNQFEPSEAIWRNLGIDAPDGELRRGKSAEN